MNFTMNRNEIRTISKESERGAIWCSVIRWDDLRMMSADEARGYFEGSNHICGLCLRHPSAFGVLKKDCGSCSLYIKFESCHDSNSFYKRAQEAIIDGKQGAWKEASNRMYEELLGLLDVKVQKLPSRTYSIGDRFEGMWRGSKDSYILASTGDGKVCLVNLMRGTRRSSFSVDDIRSITENEMSKMIDLSQCKYLGSGEGDTKKEEHAK